MRIEPVALLADPVLRVLREAVADDSKERAGILVGRPLSRRHLHVTAALEAGGSLASRFWVQRSTRRIWTAYARWIGAHREDDYVGEWHTHPGGYLEPSATDLATMQDIALTAALRDRPILLLIAAIGPLGPAAVGRSWSGREARGPTLLQRLDEGPETRVHRMALDRGRIGAAR